MALQIPAPPHPVCPQGTAAESEAQGPGWYLLLLSLRTVLALLLQLWRMYLWTHDSEMKLSFSTAGQEGVPMWKEGEALEEDRLGFEPATRLQASLPSP